MITLYVVFFILGIVGYFATLNLSFKIRVIIAGSLFFLPAIVLTILLFYFADDKPTPGSIPISDEVIDSEGTFRDNITILKKK